MSFSMLNIDVTQKFNPGSHPQVVDELMALKNETSSFPDTYKSEIIISFLKDHSLKNLWIDANPSLVKLVTSRRIATNAIESYLESARKDLQLLAHFEAYVRTVI